MRKFAVALAYLAWTGSARRLQMLSDRMQGRSYKHNENSEKANELAKLLAAVKNPTAGWQAAGHPGSHRMCNPSGNRFRAASRTSPVYCGRKKKGKKKVSGPPAGQDSVARPEKGAFKPILLREETRPISDATFRSALKDILKRTDLTLTTIGDLRVEVELAAGLALGTLQAPELLAWSGKVIGEEISSFMKQQSSSSKSSPVSSGDSSSNSESSSEEMVASDNDKSKTGGYELLQSDGVPIKAWTRGVPVEAEAKVQIENVARMPFVHSHVAVMPDVHLGKGATIGTVVPTVGAVIPAAVGVDIGCGMMAVRTSLDSRDLPENLGGIREAIEKSVPHGRQFKGKRDVGSWPNKLPDDVIKAWMPLADRFLYLCSKHSILEDTNNANHLGTLGTGNHFIELCLDLQDRVWIMLHSGSRGVGNKIGTYFIERAKKDMARQGIELPDRDLAYLQEGSPNFDDYVDSVEWAQNYARVNREVMMARVIAAMRKEIGREFDTHLEAVNCHHNYVNREHHFGKDVLVTRKGAVSAREGQMGIIPGSMGAKSFIVRGRGNADSFCSCSHGAGRVMSRTKAKKLVSLEEHLEAVSGVECRKDKHVIDETPKAYKPIEKVMDAQSDLIEVVYVLKQIVCVKG